LQECEQVAAVCYRVRGGSIKFLLVQTRGSGRWTFPKGSTEPGLTHAQAAALEAFEEAGVHGKIEETSFARYVRSQRNSARSSSAGSAEKEFAVNAFFCQVLRLSPPPEANRNRTWFSAADARRRLREGRRSGEGAALARVIERAVARILRVRSGSSMVEEQRARALPGRQRDPLQKVRFEFARAYGRPEDASSMRYIRCQVSSARQSALPIVDPERREILPCKVLEFENPRGLPSPKKVKALGTGVSER
jgi:8-oxo-dGTP pyrophosphatase MutT (NUDIX family)